VRALSPLPFLLLALLAAGLTNGCGEAAPPPKVGGAPGHVASRPAPVTSEHARGAGHSTGVTYEEALAIPEDLTGLAGERELTDTELAAPMRNAAFVARCETPEATKVTVRVVIKSGKVLGLSVYTRPDDPTIAECIDREVRALAWPESKRRDSFTTTY
jgi:hypothetical protein